MGETTEQMLARIAAECEADTADRPRWRARKRLVFRGPYPTSDQLRAELRRVRQAGTLDGPA